MRDKDRYADGRIKKTAFMPRHNGADRAGLSVSIVDPDYSDLHRNKFHQPGKLTATIGVSSIRAIGLDITEDPDHNDPRHALITGIPDLTRGDTEKREAERFAEQLAKRARLYTFPT
jgi:hypothetical protein